MMTDYQTKVFLEDMDKDMQYYRDMLSSGYLVLMIECDIHKRSSYKLSGAVYKSILDRF